MNWFSKLFSKVAREEKPVIKEPIAINFKDLEPWFDSKVSDKIALVSKQVQAQLNNLSSETNNLKTKLETLRTASLQNPNIPIRAKQYMEGNREAYIKSIRQFISSLELNQLDPLEIPNFCKDIKRKLDSLAKNTHKPYSILQEFFAHESSDIARSLKKILNTINELEKLYSESALSDISQVNEEIRQIKNKITQLESLNKSILNLEIELKSLSANLSKLNSDKESLMNSENYKKYAELKIERSQLTSELRNLEQHFIDNFQSLEPALKRFAKISFNDERLINNYLANPIKSVLNDHNLQILQILENLSKNIQSSSIQLKDKKEKKTLERIKDFSHEYLKGFIERHNSLSAKLREFALMIEQTNAESLISEINQRIQDISYRLDNKTIQLSNLRKEQDKFDLNLSLQNLANKISVFLKEEVFISL